MERIVVDFDNFLFKHFTNAILQFIRGNFNIDGDAKQGVLWVEHNDNTAFFSDSEERDFTDELFDQRKRLFFPFSLPNFGEPIPCADGEEYALEDYIFYNEGYENDNLEDDDFEMDHTNIMGFLLEVDHNKLIIKSAQYNAANSFKGETIDTLDFCSVFDYPMTDFIYQFIRK